MNALEKYKSWLNGEYFDDETKQELAEIKDKPEEIEERFYKDLEFGTGGLRGILGAGTNRMNIYTVRKASFGVARYVSKMGEAYPSKGIVIAYDSRHMSFDFALEAARVFAANGVKAWLFDELRPTPELSFAVRYLGAAAGIVITASHNPKEYNGYKVYGHDGGQLPLDAAKDVLNEINQVDITEVKVISRDEAEVKGLLTIIGSEIDDAYIDELKKLCVNPGLANEVTDSFKVVYTPLHGAGNKLVRRILKETGVCSVFTVPEQEMPDPDFSTVKSPNPEEKEAFTLAIKLAKKEKADLIIGTDPDSDRVGVVVPDITGEYIVLTGNQTGCLILEYILSQKKANNTLPQKAFVVKTIVTTGLAEKIAGMYAVELVEVLTGFKFIGEQIKLQDEQGDKKFLFGFEESYGYLAGTSVRDKDGVVASMLIAEMAAWYKSRGMSLFEGLQELFAKYGFFLEGLKSFTLSGKEGLARISDTMKHLRENKPDIFGSFQVKAIRDYLQGIRYDLQSGNQDVLGLPESDVLYFELTDGSWFCIRPSGTEPKLKVYFSVSGNSLDSSKQKKSELEKVIVTMVEQLLHK